LAKETDGEVEKMLFLINYFAPVLLTKLLLGRLRNSEEGKIVITSSIAGKFGYFLRSTYSATKHALHGYFESLRMEEEANGLKVLFMIVGRAKTNISINAMTQNGKKYGKMDNGQESGLSTEQVSKQIIAAIKKNKRETLIGGKEIYMVYFKKYFSWLFYAIANKKIKTEGGV
jgi:short-subunit dehydrogenase